jgi:pimeloyl-ACP methyl ester carboxylesterase
MRGAMTIFVDGMAATKQCDRLSSGEDIKRLRVPSLVVTGENTIQIHRIVDEELIHPLPNVINVTIPNAGHGSARENSTAFSAMLAFLVGDGRANGRARDN